MSSGMRADFAKSLVGPLAEQPCPETGRLFRAILRGVIFAAPILTSLGLPALAPAQTIDKAVVDRVKDATVLIKIKAGKLQGSGSGFVFKVMNDSVLVMTNRHVAVPDAGELPEGEKTVLTAVFRSGTPQEQELPAILRGYGYGELTDLAVLEIKGLTRIPEPIKADLTVTEAEFYETMPAYAIGFPLGGQIQQISGNVKQNPAVTVNVMSISSLRRDENNMLARIQLAGSIIGGNSGGPVVDAKGRLVGVVVSRLVGENVGFAVPPGIISDFLSGHTGEPLLIEVLGSVGPSTQLKVVMRLVDPLGRVSGCGVSYTNKPIPPEGFKKVSGATYGFPEMPGATNIKMMRDGDRITATFPLPINTTEDRKVHLQFSRYDFTGKSVWNSPPVALNIPDKPGKVLDFDSASKPKTLTRWSCESNLGEGIKINHKPGTTTIDLPANVALNNAPQYKLYNAPCALVKVDGDFVASVQIDDTFDPGGEAIELPSTGKKLGFSFQSAGLLIWQDEKNFVRFERNKRSNNGLLMINQVLVEVYKNGKTVATHYIDIPERDVAVAAVRKGGSLQLLFALPPNKLGVFYEMAIDFKKEVFVGIAAANLSKRPFGAKLDNFQLLTLEGSPIEAKPHKMEKLVEPGYTKMLDGTIVYEGAALRIAGKDTGLASPQTNMGDYKGSWSDNRQLLWKNDKDNALLSLEIPIDTEGTYEVKAKFTQGPDYGIARLELADSKLYKGGKIDFYASEIKPTSLFTVGTMKLKKGTSKFIVYISGKNPKSSGYHLGIDEIQLVPKK